MCIRDRDKASIDCNDIVHAEQILEEDHYGLKKVKERILESLAAGSYTHLYLKEQGKLKDDTVVTTVMSNMGLYKAFDKLGIHYEQTAVGDKYVCENMMANGYVIGGEQSGHIIFKEHAVTGDGILTSLMIKEASVSYTHLPR